MRDRAQAGEGQREREREREGDTESKAGSGLWAVSTEPDAGPEPTNCEIMTWAKVGCLTEGATQEPQKIILKKNKVGELILPEFKIYNKTRIIKIYR